MKTKHRFITIALVACCALGVASAGAQTYSLTNLGVLPKKETSVPAAINDQAQVTGTSAVGPFQSAFCYDNYKKGLEDVSGIPNSISRGFGINNAGQMVGDSTFGESKAICRAAIFTNGLVKGLGTLRDVGPYSRANGINVFGQVVGFSGPTLDGSESRAFAWSWSTGMFDLGTLGGAYAQALAINDAGFVTGNSQIADSSLGAGLVHAFIYQPFSVPLGRAIEQMRDLGTLGGSYSYGTFINANNHVVGYSTINNTDDRIHAFLYDGGKMIDLGSLGGAALGNDYSYALGVNANDQVVGYTYRPINMREQVAFIYRQGVMTDLNDLVGSAVRDYRLVAATAINNKGQIVAIALENSSGAYRAVLLTPRSR